MSRRSKPAPIEPTCPEANPTSPEERWALRLTLRLAEVAEALGISRWTLERERSAGRFPSPDLKIGKAPLWRPESIRAWIDGQSRKPSGQEGTR